MWHDEDLSLEEDSKTYSFRELVRRVYPYLKPYKRTFFFALAWAFAGVLLVLVQPIILKHIIDNDIPSGNFNALALSAGIYLGTMVLSAVFGFYSNWMAQKAGTYAVNDLKVALFGHALLEDEQFPCRHVPALQVVVTALRASPAPGTDDDHVLAGRLVQLDHPVEARPLGVRLHRVGVGGHRTREVVGGVLRLHLDVGDDDVAVRPEAPLYRLGGDVIVLPGRGREGETDCEQAAESDGPHGVPPSVHIESMWDCRERRLPTLVEADQIGRSDSRPGTHTALRSQGKASAPGTESRG